MTKKELLKKKLSELRSMAKELGLSFPRTAKKEDIAAAISKALRLKTLREKQPTKAKEVKVERLTPEKRKRIRAPKVAKVTVSPPVELKPVSVEEERPVSIPEIMPVITKNLLGLVPIDQQHFYLYWEVQRETFSRLTQEGRLIIRIYDITEGRDIPQAPYFELYVQQEAGGFHIDMGRAGDFCAEMGIMDKGRFTPFLRSNIIRLPRFAALKELPEAARITFPSGIVHPTSP